MYRQLKIFHIFVCKIPSAAFVGKSSTAKTGRRVSEHPRADVLMTKTCCLL